MNILKNGNNFQKFSEILNERKNKLEVVATFLALLELSKMGKISIGQEENFQDITIKLEENSK
jgi:chromatin segregation and condensation protein Rec8/ScpA/Scc1 (kleisin family)